MATEKYFVFSESGELKRMKGRIVRFLDNEDPSGSDKSAIRTSLEVSPDAAGLVQADIGTAPNEIPVNGMLGDMAYQSSEGISVDNLEVTGKLEIDSSGNVSIGAGDIANNGSLHVYRSSATADLNLQSAGGSGRSFAIQSKTNGSLVVRDNNGAADRLTVGSGGHIGISNNSPGSANGSANNLVIGNATDSTSTGISIVTQPGQVGSLFFADGTSGVSGYIGRVQYNHGTNSMTFGVNGIVPWAINSSGNLVSNGAYGIDFGAVASGTGTVTPTTGGLLDDYETGTWSPTIAPNTGSFATATTYVYFGKYTKVGNLVTANCYIRTDGTLDTTGGSGTVQIHGLPFTTASANDYASVNVGYAYSWSAAPAGGYVLGNTNKILLTKRSSSITGNLIGASVSDLDTSGGARNEIMISVTYQTT